ncbi:hypothetical protein Q9233_000486 [Columba guinea]|nr:hypothetical protein Q9233_000486 [Columba guinea]
MPWPWLWLDAAGLAFPTSSSAPLASGSAKTDPKSCSNNTNPKSTSPLHIASASACRLCPAGWQPFAAKCYWASTKTSTWEEAAENCGYQRSQLVVLESAEEKAFIGEMTRTSSGAWMGLSIDRTRGQEWSWWDGSALQAALYARIGNFLDVVKSLEAKGRGGPRWEGRMMLLAKARAHLDQQRFVICFGINQQRRNIRFHLNIRWWVWQSPLSSKGEQLQEQYGGGPGQLLVDTSHLFPVHLPFAASPLRLDELHIPAALNLPFLVRL